MVGSYREFPPPGGDSEPPGRAVVAGVLEDSTGRVAWIEEGTQAPQQGYLPVELTINVAGGESPAWRTGLYTYNPYFGCDVHLIRFFGDVLVIVYTDKHGPLVARAVPAAGERSTIRIGDDFAFKDDVLAHTDEYEDVVHHLSLPEMAPAVPLPIPPPAERPHRIELEIEDGGVRWADRVPSGEPGRWDWRVQRRGVLRLPGPEQRGFPADREALWARLRELLEDADAPADGPDILIATAGLLFWLPRRNSTARRGIGIPALWWFAAAYYLFLLQNAATDQAAGWLAWLERIAAGYQAIPQGWDLSWSATEGSAQLALAHIRERAAQLAQGCHRGALPDYPFWSGWAKGGWEHPVPLTEFPEPFARAWERVPPRFFPGGPSRGR